MRLSKCVVFHVVVVESTVHFCDSGKAFTLQMQTFPAEYLLSAKDEQRKCDSDKSSSVSFAGACHDPLTLLAPVCEAASDVVLFGSSANHRRISQEVPCICITPIFVCSSSVETLMVRQERCVTGTNHNEGICGSVTDLSLRRRRCSQDFPRGYF